MVSLGFVPGVEVIMVQNLGRGALIVQIRDARLALGRGEAQRILIVRPRIPA
jgi:Fe2+ transport system protein FeoA